MDCSHYEKLMAENEIGLTQSEIENYKTNGQKLLDESFNQRLNLHATLPKLSKECKSKLKILFTKMRRKEDYIGSLFYKTPQIPPEAINYKKDPAPLITGQPYPYHLAIEKDKFEFKSGDIIISKGVSFTSSTISSVTNPTAVFSHIILVHVDLVTKKVETMESYIGMGVKIFSVEEALKNENARILVLRLKDQTLAQAAADYMYKRIKKSEADESPIPYDYDLDFRDNSKLSCEEIAYDSLKTTSRNNFIIPEIPSRVEFKDGEFIKKIGLKSGDIMFPGDMEVDSRFNIVLDWTDFKVIRDNNRKDAVSSEIFRWMNVYDYKIHKSLRSQLAGLVWSTRHIPGLWHIMAKIAGIPSDLKKDVPHAAITTLESIKEIAGLMLSYLSHADEEIHLRLGRWMSTNELHEALEKYRTSHPEKLEKLFSSTKS